MKEKLTYAELKHIQRMSQKQLSFFIDQIYQQGYKDGWEACQKTPGDVIDFELLKIAIQATEGIGEKKQKNIIDNINNLCFNKKRD